MVNFTNIHKSRYNLCYHVIKPMPWLGHRQNWIKCPPGHCNCCLIIYTREKFTEARTPTVMAVAHGRKVKGIRRKKSLRPKAKIQGSFFAGHSEALCLHEDAGLWWQSLYPELPFWSSQSHFKQLNSSCWLPNSTSESCYMNISTSLQILTMLLGILRTLFFSKLLRVEWSFESSISTVLSPQPTALVARN